MQPAMVAQPRSSHLGVGVRTCIVLSALMLGGLLWVYRDNVEYWQGFQRCEALTSTPPPPIGFRVIESSGTTAQFGTTRYRVCDPKRPPDWSADLQQKPPLPPGCEGLIVSKAATPVSYTLEGAPGASREQVELAAARLGLEDDLHKLIADRIATPSPTFATAEIKAEYDACVARPTTLPRTEPKFPMGFLLAGLAWIWVPYGAVRFIAAGRRRRP